MTGIIEHIENKMLSVSRVVFFVLSFVALIIFIFITYKLLNGYFYQPDISMHIYTDNIKEKYKNYKYDLKNKKLDNNDVVNEEIDDNDDIYTMPDEVKTETTKDMFERMLSELIENINAYIRIVDGDKGIEVNEDKMYILMSERLFNLAKISGDMGYSFLVLDGLNTEIKDYLNDADNISKLENDHIDKIDMRKFVIWYLDEYQNIIHAEKSRVDKEIEKSNELKSNQLIQLYISASTFLTFITLTLFLVIFKIEKNTRKN